MAAEKGRAIVVKRNGVAIAGVRTKSVAINAEPIDVTDDDSGGWATKLDAAAEQSVNISVSGIALNYTLLTEAIGDPDADKVAETTFLYSDGSQIEGQFFLASYTETGEYNGAKTFECEFQSTGAVTYHQPT
jgi:TP901-1 family phage major tail protein